MYKAYLITFYNSWDTDDKGSNYGIVFSEDEAKEIVKNKEEENTLLLSKQEEIEKMMEKYEFLSDDDYCNKLIEIGKELGVDNAEYPYYGYNWTYHEVPILEKVNK